VLKADITDVALEGNAVAISVSCVFGCPRPNLFAGLRN
jgi:hypothetical protein